MTETLLELLLMLAGLLLPLLPLLVLLLPLLGLFSVGTVTMSEPVMPFATPAPAAPSVVP